MGEFGTNGGASHTVQIKERSLLGNIESLKKTQTKILGSDTFCILQSEGVTEIGALYKVSSSKFALVIGSKTLKEKVQGREMQYRFGSTGICFNFCR